MNLTIDRLFADAPTDAPRQVTLVQTVVRALRAAGARFAGRSAAAREIDPDLANCRWCDQTERRIGESRSSYTSHPNGFINW